MSSDQTKQQNDGEINDSALDGISGGQAAQATRTDAFVVTATRLKPSQNAAARPIEPIVVSATKLTPDKGSNQVASANTTGKKPV
jgi:hypothetical protein